MKKALKNGKVFQIMEDWAPKHFAYDWDSVGLQVGSFQNKARKIMVTLDVLENVVDEAIEEDVDLIIAHHPLLFKPIKQINFDQAKGRVLKKLLAHDITVYAAHTNLDITNGGVNDMLCEALDIQSIEVLKTIDTEKLFKLAVFVPEEAVTTVMQALHNSGAGHIGEYSHCTFRTKGTGTFKPLDGTTPYIGKQNELTSVSELKIETIVPLSKLQVCIEAMKLAHPYEEVAYDVYPLQLAGEPYGLGRIGKLQEKITLSNLCEKVKEYFHLDAVRVIGDVEQEVQKVAILGGSGENYIQTAKQRGADVYITGDLTFHTAQDALDLGLSVIDAGHYIEKVMKDGVKHYLTQKLKEYDVEIVTSSSVTDPFQFI
ncbi:Nif3-like dinuclear metal center hexameric protein [Virgibacillus soli]|uniref:Nif3-like dinuclear metal center hexameric protein n=1 Tax=Paracerasibacillus soli TaxID=480284 RepID=UPI0035EA8CF0